MLGFILTFVNALWANMNIFITLILRLKNALKIYCALLNNVSKCIN